jgi:hypothetical protein
MKILNCKLPGSNDELKNSNDEKENQNRRKFFSECRGNHKKRKAVKKIDSCS